MTGKVTGLGILTAAWDSWKALGIDPDSLTVVLGAGGAFDDRGRVREGPAGAAEVLGTGGPFAANGMTLGTPAGT